jgi:deoxyribodipyrimidine photo-lyase
MAKQKISIFWFRRDLRLQDNHGLLQALKSPHPVLPIFIYDNTITQKLVNDDARISFIYDHLSQISTYLKKHSTTLRIEQGEVLDVWKKLGEEFEIQSVYANEDYEPSAILRDQQVLEFLNKTNIPFNLYKDQVIFAKGEVLKNDGTPYTVYTPYKNKWLSQIKETTIPKFESEKLDNYLKFNQELPSLSDLGFKESNLRVRDYSLNHLDQYEITRNFPAREQTSDLAPHLRFGTVSIRQMVEKTKFRAVFLSELIWREFFMQILFNFPHVVNNNFKSKYDSVEWRNDLEEFEKWKKGETGYPMVDAGMRELNQTGYMHNRVRMITAGFLCKHLLIDWKWGEAYFASKLMDYEQASNNGNWQWSAGTGCDSAPYFRIFNPSEQIKKFDTQLVYIKKWIPELNSLEYPTPMVDHKYARERALITYKQGLAKAIED